MYPPEPPEETPPTEARPRDHQDHSIAKPLRGTVRYERCRLCNDCALDYELAKAAGDIESIEDFIPASRSTRQA